MVFAILMIGLIPLNGIGQSVLGPYVLQAVRPPEHGRVVLGGAVIWIGALAGSYLAWRTLDRIGRITSIVAALIGFVVVYVLMVTVAFGTAWLVPLFCLLGVVTWWGASACWPLPSELAPTEVRGAGAGARERAAAVEHRGQRAAGSAHAGVGRVSRHGAARRRDLGRVHPAGAVGPAVRAVEEIARAGERRSAPRPSSGADRVRRGGSARRASWCRARGVVLQPCRARVARRLFARGTWLIASAIAPRTSALAPSSPSATG